MKLVGGNRPFLNAFFSIVSCFFPPMCVSLERLYAEVPLVPRDVEPDIWTAIEELRNAAPAGQSASHAPT